MDGPSEPGPARLAGSVVNKVDFERLLATRSCGRSAHFALHHVKGTPLLRLWVPAGHTRTELSTDPAPTCPHPVHETLHGFWFGCVVPKRHARRAVTRTLLKRQVRAAFQRHAVALPEGLWLVRLRAPFAVAEFISACSTALTAAARSELDMLLGRARA